jgi:hypothetical protein
MSPLRETQARIAAALDGRDDGAAALIFANGIDGDVRLAVYENNAWCAFRNTLALEFPAVERLGGDEWFRGAAREYRRRFPSRAGNLHHVGEHFPAFLADTLAGTGYEVIADVAALEWALQEVQIAAQADGADVSWFAGLAPASFGAIRFVLGSDCRLVASAFPIVDVWSAQRDVGGDPPHVDLAAGPQRVLVRRAGLDVEFRRLDAAHHAFLAALAADAPLDGASAAAFAVDPEFDLPAALQRYVALGVLTSPHLPN